ncbi:hypothetical protein D7I47_08575 [Protaetiibacter intestinalis]|uniref:DUF559 domain-containing protein n=2 Tax=Protaetiibacter intestinalis TaxID=2419774 RepID=A0A387B3U7_9MICO|nr:hypothetical protein D7I47_08575 [Protaetiibacter intestinalis]
MDDSQLGTHISVGEALAAGMTREDLRRDDPWHTPFWGIRSRVEVTDLRRRAEAFIPRMPDRAFYFGPTAAALHGIPIPSRKETVALHIGVPTGQRRVDARGVVAHHVIIDVRDITTVDGLPVASPARTWCDLAAGGLHRHEVVAAGDRILWAAAPLGTVDDLRGALSRYEGRRGSKLMRDALPVLSAGSASPRETWLRVLLIDAGLPDPEVQLEVLNKWGRLIGHCDLGWARRRIGIEYEGEHHRSDAAQWAYDIQRYREMEQAGWIIIRVTAADFIDAPARSRIVRQITATFSARVRTFGVG